MIHPLQYMGVKKQRDVMYNNALMSLQDTGKICRKSNISNTHAHSSTCPYIKCRVAIIHLDTVTLNGFIFHEKEEGVMGCSEQRRD